MSKRAALTQSGAYLQVERGRAKKILWIATRAQCTIQRRRLLREFKLGPPPNGALWLSHGTNELASKPEV
jgi:hypothetical protein